MNAGATKSQETQESAPIPEIQPTEATSAQFESRVRTREWKKPVARLVIAVCTVAVVIEVWPAIVLSMNTVSTDDAYVNSHVTFLAPRVSGQVEDVLVDDNDRVSKGDVLVRLDPTPYQIAVGQKHAALVSAQADLVAASANAHGLAAQARANRFVLENTIQKVDEKIANLRSSVATYASQQAALDLARSNLRRAEELAPSGAISQQELDINRQTVKADEANVDEALQLIYANRVSLGLNAKPSKEHDLTEVPNDLDQTYSSVRASLAKLIESNAELGYFTTSWVSTPKQVVEDFLKQDPQGNLDRIFAKIIPNAPLIKQAEAKVFQAQRDLEQAELDLLYCDIVSEIDGVVTRRNVNPGNNVQVGESLMAVRSLSEIWIDANFKETQLTHLRIGQRVECGVDMYGTEVPFQGRITGFTMGTGQTLALLPPQNATGNFVKIVQRLPVRIELTNYNPNEKPLFVGLSVTPRVFYKEPATGGNAGEYLRPNSPLPKGNLNHALAQSSPVEMKAGDQHE